MSTSDKDLNNNALEPSEADPEEHVHIPDLPLSLRIGLLILGWFVIVLGLAGLLLPGLQGVLLLMLGAAILSVASDSVHRWLEGLLEHRPRMRQRLNAFRTKLQSKLHRSD
jgi:hypothetical protein